MSYPIYSADHCVNPVGNREEYTFYELFKDDLGRFYGTQETTQDHFCAGFIGFIVCGNMSISAHYNDYNMNFVAYCRLLLYISCC